MSQAPNAPDLVALRVSAAAVIFASMIQSPIMMEVCCQKQREGTTPVWSDPMADMAVDCADKLLSRIINGPNQTKPDAH
jgi:hypothetical protein